MKAQCNLLVLASSLLCAVAPLAFAIDDPFADTKFHYLGGGQVTAANDYIKAGDFPDARFAADADNPLHGATVADPNTAFYASYTNDAIRLENVVCRYRGETLTNAPCIHFAQYTTEANGTPEKIWPTYLQLPELFSMTNQCTVFLRFKCEGFPARKDNLRQTILSLGYEKGAKIGYLFGIAGTQASPKFQVVHGQSATTLSNTFKTNVWTEAACVISGRTISTYFDYEKGYLKKQSTTVSATAVDITTASASRRVFKIGGEQRLSSHDYGQDDYWKQFRGSIHEVAIWDRALSEAEIRQVFAGPHGGNSLWRYGAKDGASGEFTGTADAVSATRIGDWRLLKPSLSAQSPSTTVNFFLPHTTDATIPKRLVIAAAATSSTSPLAISVNETPCGTLSIQPGGEAICEIPASRWANWASVENTVTISLEGGGPFVFDAMRLENIGWQIGYTGKNTSEFIAEDDAYRLFTAESSNWKEMNRVLLIRDWRRTLEVRFSLTEQDAARGTHKLTWAMWNGGSTTYPKTVSLFVNGSATAKEVVTFPASASAGELIVTETEFAPGELVDGDNYFTFTGGMANASDSQQGYVSIDYFRLDSRFEKGGVVILR